MYRSKAGYRLLVALLVAVFSLMLAGSAALAASAFQEGLAFGQENAATIRSNLDQMQQKAAENDGDYRKALKAARDSEEIYQKILPSKVEWMKGVAEGAGVSYQDLLIFNTVDRAYAGYEGECTTFIAHGSVLASGKGSIIAKNRDLGANTLSEVAMHQASNFADDAIYKAAYIDIPQVDHTYKFVGSRSAGRWGYGMGVNEHQVIVADNDAPTREKLAYKEGLHDNDYVRLILERAKTAREGVEVLTSITEKYGQSWNCIMFEIADPNELWVVEVTGYRWVAKKYENTVTARSNQLQIEEDYDMAADDLVSFAIEQGWVDEGTEHINFREVYGTYELYPSSNENFADRPAVEKLYNTEMRYQRAMELLKAKEGKLEPKSFVPMMRDHYDKVTLPSGKVLEMNQVPFYSTKYADMQEWVGKWPEKDTTEHPLFMRSICHHGMGGVTASAAILVARPDVPDELGLMLHAFRNPCLSTFVPFYIGANRTPVDYSKPGACAKFLKITKTALGSYNLYHDQVRQAFDPYEKNLWNELPRIEKLFMGMKDAGNLEKGQAYLTTIVEEKCDKVMDLADQAWDNMVEAAAGSSAWSR
ncbi:MAG: C69 family dipeptidase [Synergistales bacterium]|nr:C69 family dipeptidase [Synergistales bacterium]